MNYYIWTEGCQMNYSDSQRVSAALERLGYLSTQDPSLADIIVLNTCVVRQSAEDKAFGRLQSLRPIKQKRPEVVVNLMGCLVGMKDNPRLRERFPYVDVFSAPSDPTPLLDYLQHQDGRQVEVEHTATRFAWMDGDLPIPESQVGEQVIAFVPVVLGCSHACTYCIIPYRRGGERSRPPADIIAEVEKLAQRGVKEVTLLGQIVDRYGKDDPSYPTLAGLLHRLNDVNGLERIRFLTSHPSWMTDELLDAIVELPKVMPHIEVPVQAGDDDVLTNMRRGYTADDYRRLVDKIRMRIPGVSIATDVIVGFPGETAEQFQHTYDLLADLKLDVAHLARYSPRSGTVSARRMDDDVPSEEKWRRFRLLEELQTGIVTEIHQSYVGKQVEVLFEDQVKGRWRGRTPTNKLVFVESQDPLRGELRTIRIQRAGAWSMNGEVIS
ncbi:MAG TPA: tRNA (N6-isopentenyl adenosine(37)-C2)-methylthiotransferase MiaB [Longilinea sp.]|nr:tRNA (N6-isopentenyl adenosine(37)-C2)-methylthiotransferase MiaB [Longilinea sp.]